MLSILLPAARQSTPEEAQSCWGDLRVALASIAAYAPGTDVVVGWSGREEPRDLPPNPAMRLMPQAEGIRTGSEAWNWCAQQTDADYLLILGDDCVLHPSSVPALLEDSIWLKKNLPGTPVGLLGARSNYVKGPQNIRYSAGESLDAIQYQNEQKILEVPMVVPVAALIRRDVFQSVDGFPRTNWFADDIMSWDLRNAGFRHFASRAYVHHVGQRATGQDSSSLDLWNKGLQWVQANRPDFYAHLISQGVVQDNLQAK